MSLLLCEMSQSVFAHCLFNNRLQAECARLGIEIHRRVFEHIDEALDSYPDMNAVFNCTGLGALTLGGVEDKSMYSARVSYCNFCT